MIAPRLALSTLVLLTSACLPPPLGDPTDDGSSSTNASDATTTTTAPPPPVTTTSTTAPDPDSGSTSIDPTGSSSTGPGGVGEGEECDLHAQDCAPGLKCMPYSTAGSGWWDAAACFPIDPEPVDIGEPCQWQGGPWSGYDNCGWGQVCWSFDQEEGVCKGLCLLSDPSDWDSLYCEDRETTPYIGCQSCFCVCETSCDPLGQECGAEQLCVASSDIFTCVPDASGDMGAYGDPCEFINACDPGLVCLSGAATPGCDPAGVGCCTPFCDINQPNTCPGAAEGQTCQAWWEPAAAPPGQEHLGVCALPL